MTVWYKEGVLGDLNPGARRGKRIVQTLYKERGYDLYITSKRDGNHDAGSCHPEGDAFDFRKAVTIDILVDALGPNYDVVEHRTHYHVEYDPK